MSEGSKKPKPCKNNVHGGAAKKTDKGPHGGGNKFFQAKTGKGFVVHDGRPGGVGGKINGSKSDNGDK